MKQITLLMLRIALGWLLVIWGADKVFNLEHSLKVANMFYSDTIAVASVLQVVGVFQMLIGFAVVVGFARRWVYPIQALLNAGSLFAVIKSVMDPWGWVLSGTNALFYPSIIIFSASLLLIAFCKEDSWVLGSSKASSPIEG
jgi:uncharacterized membrane protein YphA (DoxX/SURF4 family)